MVLGKSGSCTGTMALQNMSSSRVSEIIRGAFQRDFEVDRNLPPWARRTHPVVRRHLGTFWRVMPLQPDIMLRWYLLLSLGVLSTLLVPFMYTVVLPLCLIGLALLPFGLVYYARTLYELANDASRSMVREIEGKTLDLLLTSPMSAREVLLSKIAATMWRQSDPMTTLLQLVLFSQLPTHMLIYINAYPPTEYPIIMQVLAVAVFGASLIRIPLEIFMVSSIGHFVGTTTRGRSTAAASTLVVVVVYFISINMFRLAPLPPLADLMVNAVLPVVMPLVIGLGFMALTLRQFHD
jgi:hypothetical protein